VFTTQTLHGELVLPDLTTLPTDVVDLVLRSSERYRMWVLFETVADAKTLAVLDELPLGDLTDVITQWETAGPLKIEELVWIRHLSRRHRNPLEADLINAGLRLRHCPSAEFTWRDLWIFAKYTPVTSNLYRAMFRDDAGWTKENMLLAEAVDTLHWLQWVKTKAGQKNRDRPKPWPRPNIAKPVREGSKPKPAPVSVIKERFANRHRRVADRATKLKDVFGGR
jgi:Family of unknown function (DUF5361)